MSQRLGEAEGGVKHMGHEWLEILRIVVVGGPLSLVGVGVGLVIGYKGQVEGKGERMTLGALVGALAGAGLAAAYLVSGW